MTSYTIVSSPTIVDDVLNLLQVVKVTLDEGEMDTYVFCIANKKVGSKMQKDMNDLVSMKIK